MASQSDPGQAPAEQLLTRRSMLKSSVVGGAGLMFGGVVLSACSSAAKNGSQASGGGSGQKAAGEKLIIGTTTDLVPQDFLRTATNPLLFSLVWDTMAVMNPKTLAAEPSVASSWEWNKAKTVLTVHLRDDVRYHTGRLLEPADAIFSIKEEKNPTHVAQVQPTADLIEHYKVTGKHSFSLSIAKPMSAFEMLLVLTPLIDRETAGGLFNAKKVIGTGPFKFDSWTPQTSFSFSRNPRYWQPGLPHLQSVTANVYSSETAMINALRASEIDLAYQLAPADAARLTTSGTYQALNSTPAYLEWYVGANVKVAPFDNLMVRQAVAHALDRERIVKQAFAGFGTTTCLPWSLLPGIPKSYNDYYSYDPSKAKALLKQARVGSPEVTIVTGAGNSTASAILNIVQYNLSAIGLKVKAQTVPTAAFQQDLTNASTPGLWINSIGLTYLELGTVLLGNAPLKIGKNTSNVTDPQYAKLADAVVFANSPEEAAQANKALSHYVLDQAWHLTVGHTPTVSAAVKNLAGAAQDGENALSLTAAKLT